MIKGTKCNNKIISETINICGICLLLIYYLYMYVCTITIRIACHIHVSLSNSINTKITIEHNLELYLH